MVEAMELEGSRMARACRIARLWPLALAACGSPGLAQASEVVRAEDRAAFVAELARTYAESDIERGKGNAVALDAVRKFLRESAFIADYEARHGREFGASCTRVGLPAAIESLIEDAEPTRATYYLTTLQAKCAHRLRGDREILSETMAVMDGARAMRAERYEQFVEKERQLALKEEQSRSAASCAMQRLPERRRRSARASRPRARPSSRRGKRPSASAPLPSSASVLKPSASRWRTKCGAGRARRRGLPARTAVVSARSTESCTSVKRERRLS
jgi:hypothetical protein